MVPLWLGTADEVDDVLPVVPGLFDLVVVDDADDLDQVSAAGALLRGRRAVVVGDPRQVRATTPVSDEVLRRALDDHGLAGQASRLDVRRASLLDVASGSTPAVWLDEHYRWRPHLVAFPAQRFYDGRVAVTTRQPANDGELAVEVTFVPTVPGIGDAVGYEVAAALERVEHLAVLEESDIAVTSPLPGVAAAPGRRPRRAVRPRRRRPPRAPRWARSRRSGPRRPTTSCWCWACADAPPALRRQVEDPDLFNLMIARARRRLLVVTTLDPPSVSRPAGLIDAFLAYARRPLGPAPQPPHRPVRLGGGVTDQVRAHGSDRPGRLPRPRALVGRPVRR